MAKKRSKSTPLRGSRPRQSGSAGARKTKRRGALRWAAIVTFFLVGVLIAVALKSNQPPPQPVAGSNKAAEVGQPVDGRKIGDPNAPVVVQAYEDFQCPHCQDFTAALEPTIMELVSQGVVRFEYYHRFVIGPDSVVAGAAAECAVDQGAFWEYHDALFAAVSADRQAVQPERLKSLAADIGLDTGEFNRCLDSQQHYEQMLREDNEARNRGINATPTIFINGTLYQGDFSPEAFRAAVEAARS